MFDVFRHVRSSQFDGLPLAPEQLGLLIEQQYAAQQAHFGAEYPDANCDVILLDAQPVGYLRTCRGETHDRILDIALLPEFSGKQVGSHVMGELIERSVAEQRVIQAHVEKLNPAVRFWHRLGFRTVGDDGVFLEIERHP